MKILISLFALILTNSHISLTPPPPPPPMPMPTAKATPVAAKAAKVVTPVVAAPAPMPAPTAMPVAAKAAVPAVATPVAAAPVVAAAVKSAKPTTVPLIVPFSVKVEHLGKPKTNIAIDSFTFLYNWSTLTSPPQKFIKSSKGSKSSNKVEFKIEPKQKSSTPTYFMIPSEGQANSPETFIGISSLTINGDIIDISPAWSPLETDTIYVKTNKQGKIVVDKKAMKKAANNGGTLPAKDATVPTVPTPKTVPTKTTAPATPAQTPQNPTPATKAVATTIVNRPPATTPVTKKSKSGKSTKKALATKATTVA